MLLGLSAVNALEMQQVNKKGVQLYCRLLASCASFSCYITAVMASV